jgi:hypothetical protein
LCLAFRIGVNPIPAEAQDSSEQELVRLVQSRCAADLKRDPGIVEPVLADDFTNVSSRRVVSTKATYLAGIKSRAEQTTSCTTDNVKVRVYGDAAVVTDRLVASVNGAPIPPVLQTHTFVRKAGRWQLVASHSAASAAP